MNTTPFIRMAGEQDAAILARTIREAFKDVAVRFGLTRENCPRHPSNCAEDWIRQDRARGAIYFILEESGAVAGCAAMEPHGSDVCYLERLSVLPQHREKGYGAFLVSHVLGQAADIGASRMEIGIIAHHAELKEWYRKLGFSEGETKEFPHLPFKVTFMAFDLRAKGQDR